MKHIKTQDELLVELMDQIGFLQVSVQAYDSGMTAEAKRIAAVIRTLLKDNGRNSNSLLNQLDVKDKLRFHSTSEEAFKEGYGLGIPLRGGISLQGPFHSVRTSFDGNVMRTRYIPYLDEPKSRLAFDEWWNQYLIDGFDYETLTRSELILTIAEKDGGVHVDPSVDGTYADLSRRTGIGHSVSVNGEVAQPFLGEVERVLMRQIAHEILGTFEEQLPDLLNIYVINHDRDFSRFKWLSNNIIHYVKWPYMRGSSPALNADEDDYLATIGEEHIADAKYRQENKIMLRTGCVDQNGNEIYEGDTVQLWFHDHKSDPSKNPEGYGFISLNPLRQHFTIQLEKFGPRDLVPEDSRVYYVTLGTQHQNPLQQAMP